MQSTDADRDASFGFLAYAMRMLAGHIHEGSNFIKQHAHFKYLKTETAPSIDERINKRIKEIRKYFSKNNVVTGLRDKIAFHTDREHLLDVFSSTSDQFVLNIFGDKDAIEKGDFSQNLFGGVDMLTLGSILKFPSSQTREEGNLLATHTLELITLASHMLEIFFLITLVVGVRYFAEIEGKEQTINISDLPNVREVKLPYFFTIGGEKVK